MSLHNVFVEARKLATASSIGASNCKGSKPITATFYPAKKIITMDPNLPYANAVAVADGKIVAVGGRKSVRRFLTKMNYKIVEDHRFVKKVIVPGFIDQHLHPLLAAVAFSIEIISIEPWELPGITIREAKNEKEYQDRLLEALKKFNEKVNEKVIDKNTFFFTWGYHADFHGTLDKSILDRIKKVIKDFKNPVVIWHRSCHEFIMNTRAHELLNVTPEWISSRSQNEQSQMDFDKGHYVEEGYMAVLNDTPVFGYMCSDENLKIGMNILKSYLPDKGVTTICEPGGIYNKELQQKQNSYLAGSEVPFNTYYIVDGKTMANTYVDDPKTMIEQTEIPIKNWGTGRVVFLPKQTKLFADGAMFSQNMKMLPYGKYPYGYTDDADHTGEWMMDEDVFNKAFQEYWKAGYQIHIHTNGSGGLERVLGQLEKAMVDESREDHRTTIVHFGYSTREQLDRLKDNGGIVSANPYYTRILGDLHCKVGIGRKRAAQMVRLKDVADREISFSLHSDMSMAPSDPLFLMWCATSRLTISDIVLGEDQCITVEQALKGVTIEAAYSLRLEKKIGSIEVGKDATFTILDQDPLDSNQIGNGEGQTKLKDIKIWGTVLEGRILPKYEHKN